MKLRKITKSREDFLKNLSQDEYRIVLNKLVSYNFLKRVNSNRMDYGTDKEFMIEFFWMIFNDSLMSPVPQITKLYEDALQEKPEDRWKHFTEREWKCFVDLHNTREELDLDNPDPTIQKLKKLFNKYFYDEFKGYRKYDGK